MIYDGKLSDTEKSYLESLQKMNKNKKSSKVTFTINSNQRLFSRYLQNGDSYSGFQKSLSKKSEFFFSELDVQFSDVDCDNSTISGIIEKKIVSITGKKHNLKVYFEGEIIDGKNNTFTSNLTAGCEVLDVYFWNRFPSFKEIESLRDLKKQSERYIYMRWYERGSIKQKKQALSVKGKQEKIRSRKESATLNPESDDDVSLQSETTANDNLDDEEAFELIEYFENTEDMKVTASQDTQDSNTQFDELNANGSYFICLDVVQNKITGYFKQAFMKNCQKLILESKADTENGFSYACCEKM